MEPLPKRIAQLIRSGRKIEAIKLLREETGVDLQTAKEAVDKLDADPAFDPISLNDKIADVSDEVKELARTQGRLAAIELLIDRTGVDEADAEQAIDDFMRSAEFEDEGVSQHSNGIPDIVKQLAWKGQKIAAIKVYRDYSGLDLKSSKEIVEQLPRDPDLPVQNVGALVITALIAVFLMALGIAIVIFFLGTTS